MEALKNIFENLKEKLKAAWAEQMDSEAVIKLREKYEELPSVGQKAIVAGLSLLSILVVLWWPVSNLMDASDNNQKFEDHRQLLKELLQVERDTASGPNPPTSAPPINLKSQFDQKITAAGVKGEQIRESGEVPTKMVNGAQEKGIQYRIDKLTIRQAIDLAYELEHTDQSLKLLNFEVKNNDPDPHFYQVAFKIVSYSPKLAEVTSSGGGLADAVKSQVQKNSGSSGSGGGSGGKPGSPTSSGSQDQSGEL